MLSGGLTASRKKAVHSLPSSLSVDGLNRLQERLCCVVASFKAIQTLQIRLSLTVSGYFESKMDDCRALKASLLSSYCLLSRNLMFSLDFRTHSDRLRWSLCLHLSSSSFKFCPRSLLRSRSCLLVIVQRCLKRTYWRCLWSQLLPLFPVWHCQSWWRFCSLQSVPVDVVLTNCSPPVSWLSRVVYS